MKICIKRGTDEIGGCCAELATDTTRILLDVGTPLPAIVSHFPCNIIQMHYISFIGKRAIAAGKPGEESPDCTGQHTG